MNKKFVEFSSVQHLYHGQVTDRDQFPDALLEAFTSMRDSVMKTSADVNEPDAYYATLMKLNEIFKHVNKSGDGVTIRLTLEVESQHDGDFVCDLKLIPEQAS